MTLQLGFIGFGQMAQAMAKGFNQKEHPPFTLHASSIDFDALTAYATPLNVQPISSNQQLVDQCDWIILAVKPDQVEGVLNDIDVASFENKGVISIASGITLDQLKQRLPKSTSILTMIPNTPVCVGEGILMCQEDTTFTQEDLTQFKDVFSHLGTIHFANGDAFKSLATLSGCGPAFVAMVIEAMADGMVKYGAPRDLAYQIASQTIKGTAQMQLDTNTHPGVLKDQVTSPGGTTIKGVAALEEKGMRHAFISAMDGILDH
ncbi:pyrroline-5-carboxylate reductase [Dolosicoccus paucivorans]|uniref:pyrroline-5-carboxylate reductase n=1 Tax=Dolosicoccus paucivorans TaxID=84521 RepID=UPI0008803B36|nr:pyrroline-5-carboxylate reductase [Dolosicoccus paucivorans]SDI36946.1 pyrroline-5-carboxylate reductase [Dolosicoccus paucivorans]